MLKIVAFVLGFILGLVVVTAAAFIGVTLSAVIVPSIIGGILALIV